MAFLRTLTLQNFKGIESCEIGFNDLTILAGLNNSGKTSILQAIKLIADSSPKIQLNQHFLHQNVGNRVLDVKTLAATFGIPDASWLLRANQDPATFRLSATFSNDLQVVVTAQTPNSFAFELPQYNERNADQAKQKLNEVSSWGAELILPPGIVSSREDMIPGTELARMVSQGKGAQYWRNNLFWSIQDGGIERFERVKELVEHYFPDVRVEIPVLDSMTSPPGILMKFKDASGAKLDISQSGSGLRTFLTLARLLEQSDANIFLLDEPDAHLHASQQAIVLRQLIDSTESSGKQVILTTHSPEILTQAPEECIRWIGGPTAASQSESGTDIESLLSSLGVQYWAAARNEAVPDVIVYVEGKTDRPIIQAVINHYRKHSAVPLPTTVVIPHKSGRFDSTAVEALQRLASQIKPSARVVGIRDLDWFYGAIEDMSEQLRSGASWACLTLPCKEIENLLCDPELLFEMFSRKVPIERLKQIVDTASQDSRLLDEWRFNVRARIRERRPNHEDDSTKERKSDETFNEWASDADRRRRLVAGKELYKSVRLAVRSEFGQTRSSPHALETVPNLPDSLARIARVIFGTE